MRERKSQWKLSNGIECVGEYEMKSSKYGEEIEEIIKVGMLMDKNDKMETYEIEYHFECKCCGIKFGKDVNKLVRHLNTKKHKKNLAVDLL